MGKTFKRNADDFDEERFRESRKERKIRQRKDYEHSEHTTRGERR